MAVGPGYETVARSMGSDQGRQSFFGRYCRGSVLEGEPPLQSTQTRNGRRWLSRPRFAWKHARAGRAGTGPSGAPQRPISRKPRLREPVDQVCMIVGTKLEQFIDRKSHQRTKCFAEPRQRIVHHRVRRIHVAHLAKSSD